MIDTQLCKLLGTLICFIYDIYGVYFMTKNIIHSGCDQIEDYVVETHLCKLRVIPSVMCSQQGLIYECEKTTTTTPTIY